jgi:membrane dipeptidase
MKHSLKIGVLLLGLAACQSPRQTASEADSETLMARANELAQQFIIVDGHVDLPYRLKSANFDINTQKEQLLSTEKGDFDFERARAGGLDAPFMSIYIPAEYQEKGGAKALADSLIDMVVDITRTYPDYFALANTPAQVEANTSKGKISLPMGMENGAPIESDLANVKHFYNRGIRYITLTHSKDNQICDSSYDTTRTWNGLSPFGRTVVQEMNRVGIMVDVAHISDSTFYQVMALSKAPVIASHSSARHFTPGFERNMSDEMIRLLAEKKGVIQINFGSDFLDKHSQDVRAHVRQYLKDNNLKADDEEAKAYMTKYYKENSYFSHVEKVADHIDHVVQLVGIEYVGLGSDYDGVGDSLPEGLKDVASYPNLIAVLLKRGYSEEDIAKICYKNVFRVWNEVEKVARGA